MRDRSSFRLLPLATSALAWQAYRAWSIEGYGDTSPCQNEHLISISLSKYNFAQLPAIASPFKADDDMDSASAAPH